MNTIVERLRDSEYLNYDNREALMFEAADEIERQGSHISHLEAHRDELMAENERLQAAVDAERERCALKAYREIIAAVDDVRLANTIRDAIRESEL